MKHTALRVAKAAAAAPESPAWVKSAKVLVKAVSPPVVVKLSTSRTIMISSTESAAQTVSRKVKTTKCGCKNKWVDEKCVSRTLKKWKQKAFMICESCFHGEYNETAHTCLGYIEPDELITEEGIEEHYRKRIWRSILNPSTLSELYRTYIEDPCELINDYDDEVIIINMKYELRRVVKVYM